MTIRAFITGTGTGVGKSWFTEGLTRHLVASGRQVVAMKPIETGCEPDPLDASALATACGRPELVDLAGFHRGRLPRAPLSATLAGDPPPPSLETLLSACRRVAEGADAVLVEGAGGLLVPYDEHHDLADLAARLGYPVVVVAPNRLGTLSNVLLTTEALANRSMRLGAVVLTEPTADPDPAAEHHVPLLERRVRAPVIAFRHGASPDDTGFARVARALEA